MTPTSDVRTAFSILLDEIDATVQAINEENKRAIDSRNYDRVQQLAERARAIVGIGVRP